MRGAEVSVFNDPYKWAREMNRLLQTKDLNKDSYAQDVLNAIVAVIDINKRNEELEAEVVRLRIWIDDPCPDCKYETEEPCDANSPCLCCKFNQPYVSNFKEKGSSPDCEKVG